MIISRGRGFVFVHIPKTGGTSMALALEDRAMADDILIGDTPKAQRRKRRLRGIKTAGRLWKHSRLADAEGLISADEMREMFVFTLVRNPWDRMVSYYSWLRAQSFDHPAVDRAKALSFSAFLAHPGTGAEISGAPSASYVCDPGGRLRCDAFVRLEHLDQDLAPVEEHLGFRLTLPHTNRSDRVAEYRAAYSPQDAENVARMAASDIDRFEYRF